MEAQTTEMKPKVDIEKVFCVEGLERCLVKMGIEVRDAMIPTTQRFSYYMDSKVRKAYIVASDDEKEFYRVVIPRVLEIWNARNDRVEVESYLKSLKNEMRKVQRKYWKGLWTHQRGNIVKKTTEMQRPLHVYWMVNGKQRVPFEVLMYLLFDGSKAKIPREEGEKPGEFIMERDKEWMDENG